MDGRIDCYHELMRTSVDISLSLFNNWREFYRSIMIRPYLISVLICEKVTSMTLTYVPYNNSDLNWSSDTTLALIMVMSVGFSALRKFIALIMPGNRHIPMVPGRG